MIATLYVFGYVSTIDEIVKRFTVVNVAEVLKCIYENKKYFGKERWPKASKELLMNAKRLMKTLTGKYKYVLMNIVDELEPKPDEPVDSVSSNMYNELRA